MENLPENKVVELGEIVMHRQVRWGIWVSVVLVFAFAAGYIVWNFSQKPEVYDNEIVAPPNHELRITNQGIEGWQTYRNEEYGFEVEYPPDFVLEESGLYPFVVIIRTSDRTHRLFINPVNVGRESVFDSQSTAKTKNINFVGFKADNYSCPDLNPCPVQLAYSRAIHLLELPSNWEWSNEIDFGISKGYEYLTPTFNRVLSTFKFIE